MERASLSESWTGLAVKTVSLNVCVLSSWSKDYTRSCHWRKQTGLLFVQGYVWMCAKQMTTCSLFTFFIRQQSGNVSLLCFDRQINTAVNFVTPLMCSVLLIRFVTVKMELVFVSKNNFIVLLWWDGAVIMSELGVSSCEQSAEETRITVFTSACPLWYTYN